MTSTTVAKPGRRRRGKERSVYNLEIDREVIGALTRFIKMNNGQMKREVQKKLGSISPKTWDTHLKRMLAEGYLIKEDTRLRNQKVFYSLTQYAEQLRDLQILRTDPNHIVLRRIYADLFFRAIIEGNIYVHGDLDEILNEIHSNRDELRIDYIRKKYSEFYEDKPQLTTVPAASPNSVDNILQADLIRSQNYRINELP